MLYQSMHAGLSLSLQMGFYHHLLLRLTFILTTGFWRVESQPAIFLFGDSLADVGNNNYLPLSTAKANFLPNGIDYQNGTPTGRFCNGRTVADILAWSLGFPISQPYLSPATTGNVLFHGVNYASGGCGILRETNIDLIECLSLSTQVTYHERTVSKIIYQLGSPVQAQNFLSSSLYFVVIGSNDYLDNYLKSDSEDRQKYTPSEFSSLLAASLGEALERMYAQGARKIAVFGLGPIGCIPSQRRRHDNESCTEDANRWVTEFNNNTRTLIQQLNLKLPNISLTFANSYGVVQRFIQQPSMYGFKVTKEACCGAGKLRAEIPCIPFLASVCPNRSEYLFWDPWHITEAANTLIANRFLTGKSEDIGPWNILQLAQR